MFTFLVSQYFLSFVTFLTLIVAFGALILTYWEIQRNNKPIAKIIACDMSIGATAEDRRFKGTFLVRVKNLGICLYAPEIALCVRSSAAEAMRISIGLCRKEDKTGNVALFAKGMIAEFISERYCDAVPDDCESFCSGEIVKHLSDPTHHIDLVLFSQNFETAKFRLNGYKAKIVRCYNGWVWYLLKKWCCFAQKKSENEVDFIKYHSFADRFLAKDFHAQAVEYLKFLTKPRDPNAPPAVWGSV